MTAQPERDFVLFSRFIEVVLEKCAKKDLKRLGLPKKLTKVRFHWFWTELPAIHWACEHQTVAPMAELQDQRKEDLQL
jgi:hypothetical protein